MSHFKNITSLWAGPWRISMQSCDCLAQFNWWNRVKRRYWFRTIGETESCDRGFCYQPPQKIVHALMSFSVYSCQAECQIDCCLINAVGFSATWQVPCRPQKLYAPTQTHTWASSHAFVSDRRLRSHTRLALRSPWDVWSREIPWPAHLTDKVQLKDRLGHLAFHVRLSHQRPHEASSSNYYVCIFFFFVVFIRGKPLTIIAFAF